MKRRFADQRFGAPRSCARLRMRTTAQKRILVDAILEQDLVRHWSEGHVGHVKRRAVSDAMRRHGLSERRPCELADLHGSVFGNEKQDQGDKALRKRLRDLANERRGFWYRRLGSLPAKERVEVNSQPAAVSERNDDRAQETVPIPRWPRTLGAPALWHRANGAAQLVRL
jgi:hypothetical protein